jgi:hypothetical protein
MKNYIGCDMHKKYSVFVTMDDTGYLQPAVRVSNDRVECACNSNVARHRQQTTDGRD